MSDSLLQLCLVIAQESLTIGSDHGRKSGLQLLSGEKEQHFSVLQAGQAGQGTTAQDPLTALLPQASEPANSSVLVEPSPPLSGQAGLDSSSVMSAHPAIIDSPSSSVPEGAGSDAAALAEAPAEPSKSKKKKTKVQSVQSESAFHTSDY